MVADALIYHPTVSHYLKFVATTEGCDKILRTLQYFSRFLAWYLYHNNRPKSSISPFKAIKKQFSATRKLISVGKFVEHFRAAAVASNAKSMEPVLRFTIVGQQLGYAFYILFDNACILDATNIRKFSSATCLLREGYRAWFTSLSFSIASGFYSYYRLSLLSTAITSSSDPEKVFGRMKVEKELNTVTVQLLSDLCDITIPSSALGWADLDDGIVSLAGTTSSLLGVWSQWKKTA